MPDRNPIAQLQQRLVELGCPMKALRRIVRETAEHYEDLQRAAHTQGLVGNQATAHAAELLGNPVELANRHVEALRNSSWWGRCPHFAFGILPLLVALELVLQYYSLNHGKLPMLELYHQPVPYPELLEWAYPAFFLAVIAITAAVTFLFVRQAQRSGAGHRWMWITAGLMAAHGLFLQIHASSEIDLTLEQPLVLANQKVSPGHPMEISIGMIWPNSVQLALYRWEQTGDSVDDFEAMPAMFKGDDYRKPYSSPDVEEKINQGVAELYQRSLRGQLPSHSLHDPGWTEGIFSANWQNASSIDASMRNTVLAVYRDDAGNLHWAMGTNAMFPWPVLSYGLPGWGYGDVFQAINIACPLVIVAAMLAWQRCRGKRLLRESSLSDGQLIGAA